MFKRLTIRGHQLIDDISSDRPCGRNEVRFGGIPASEGSRLGPSSAVHGPCSTAVGSRRRASQKYFTPTRCPLSIFQTQDVAPKPLPPLKVRPCVLHSVTARFSVIHPHDGAASCPSCQLLSRPQGPPFPKRAVSASAPSHHPAVSQCPRSRAAARPCPRLPGVVPGHVPVLSACRCPQLPGHTPSLTTCQSSLSRSHPSMPPQTTFLAISRYKIVSRKELPGWW